MIGLSASSSGSEEPEAVKRARKNHPLRGCRLLRANTTNRKRNAGTRAAQGVAASPKGSKIGAVSDLSIATTTAPLINTRCLMIKTSERGSSCIHLFSGVRFHKSRAGLAFRQRCTAAVSLGAVRETNLLSERTRPRSMAQTATAPTSAGISAERHVLKSVRKGTTPPRPLNSSAQLAFLSILRRSILQRTRMVGLGWAVRTSTNAESWRYS